MRETYIHHLERIHRMIIPRLPKPTQNPNVLPDVDDPNFYCKSCQFKYKSRAIYRYHLRQTHKMELTLLVKQSIVDPTISVADTKNPNNTCCAICKIKYCRRTYYQQHMKKFHKDERDIPVNRGRKIPPSNIQPDPNDLNFYCAPCQRRYSAKHYYRPHICLYHPDIKLEKLTRRPCITPLIAEIDAGNAENTVCTICRRDYKSRSNYRNHMHNMHKNGKKEPVVIRKSLDDSSSRYCQLCQKSFSTKWNYPHHARKFHSDIPQKAMQL